MQKVDEHFMRLALKLAEKGRGLVHPNPLVGAVLTKGGRILSYGFHEAFGGRHAEVNALRDQKGVPTGATLYTTLEPCSHVGKTPPCVELLLKKNIRHVVVAMKDPNPIVAGRGLSALKKAGVRVTFGVLEAEAEAMNRDFKKWIVKKMPYVTVKVAQTLDGNIATATGESRWITGLEARRFSHGLRAKADAVMIGVHTLLKDDPLLTARIPGVKRQPMKVILDATLKTPASSKIFSKRSPAPVLIFTTSRASRSRFLALGKKAEVIILKEKGVGRIDLKSALKILAKKGVVHLLVEGGGEVIASALKEKAVDEAYVFVAPMILGGRGSVRAVGGEGVRTLSKAWTFRKSEWSKVGKDLLLHGTF